MPEVEYLSYDVVEEQGWDLHEKDIFERAAEVDISEKDYGSVEVSSEESILDAAEREKLGWSLKCLKGRCGRCSTVIVDGEVDMDAEREFLTEREVERKNMCLACVSKPNTDLKLVYGVRKLEDLKDRVK